VEVATGKNLLCRLGDLLAAFILAFEVYAFTPEAVLPEINEVGIDRVVDFKSPSRQ
jgi:hypothetical protein